VLHAETRRDHRLITQLLERLNSQAEPGSGVLELVKIHRDRLETVFLRRLTSPIIRDLEHFVIGPKRD